MQKVVLAQKADPPVIELLSKSAEVVMAKEGDIEDLKEKLKDAAAIILGTAVKFTPELIDCAPKLKVISRTGVGVDSVDVAYATSKDILVLNTPTANSLSVAEHTVSFVCALSKYLNLMDNSIRKNNFGIRRQYLPVDIDGKTLGLIGFGGIGRLTAQKCKAAFNMNIIAYDPFITTEIEGVTLYKTMEEVFSKADYVSLHIPLTDKTKNCVDEKMLSLLKPSAFLINTSRGGIIDETALAAALSQKKFAGAALDVFENEPVKEDSPLLSLDNILLTPHSAALTKECVVRVALYAAKGVVDYLEGREPEFVYNRKK